MIVLGLDGATFSLIEPWVESGRLPNFERLLDESVHGDLESTVPEITVPAWPAFATGRDPTELDMYGFTHFNRETRENDLSHDEFVPGKMWDSVDDQGGSAVVFNIPGSYPWQAIDGTIIAAAPEYKEEYAHPPERWDELADLVDGYKLRNDERPGSRAYVDLSLELVDKRFEAFEHFIQKETPDLAVGLIRATDRVAHHYWGEDSTPPASTKNPIFEVYQRVDEHLGEFLDAHDDEDIVVMSDHGFEKVRQKFATNVALERAGLVSLTDVPTGDNLGLDNALSMGRIDWDETRALASVGQKTTLVYALADDSEGEGLAVRFERLGRGGPHTPDLAMIIETPEVHASSRFDAENSCSKSIPAATPAKVSSSLAGRRSARVASRAHTSPTSRRLFSTRSATACPRRRPATYSTCSPRSPTRRSATPNITTSWAGTPPRAAASPATTKRKRRSKTACESWATLSENQT